MNPAEAIFFILKQCFDFMKEPLRNQELFANDFSKKLADKANNNEQFAFDVETDRLIKQLLLATGLEGKIFSEESGYFDVGKPKYRIVYDPFCNSSLATRGFREAAAGMSVFDFETYELLASGILDYQTGVIALTDSNKNVYFRQSQSSNLLEKTASLAVSLPETWLVVALENLQERTNLNEAVPLLSKANRIHFGSGHIYWFKLAFGQIDGYLDPFGGEKLYEMFAASIAQAAGAIITNSEGETFDAAKLLKQFEANQESIYYPVAAVNSAIHGEILNNLKKSA